MEDPETFVKQSHGYTDRLGFGTTGRGLPDDVLLAHARTEAILAVAASINRLADVLDRHLSR